MDFDVTSNLDLNESARIFGPDGADFSAPFSFAQPPTLHASGVLDGPAAPGGEHQRIQLSVASTGAFALYGFPLGDVSFDAFLRDGDIDLPRISAAFGGGVLTGQAWLTGGDATRRLRCNLHLAGASLGRTLATVDGFVAKQNHQPSDPASQILPHAADLRLDLTAAAEGLYHDPLSFTGTGTVEVGGPELGQVRLLGLLSKLLNFTSLRFTSAKSTFALERNRVNFPDLKIAGANSAIDARGDYLLDRKTLDFNAKVYPFETSKFAPANLVGFALSPLSAALEVKLTGTLQNPSWAFAYGPTNFLRKLEQPKAAEAAGPSPAPAAKPGDNAGPAR
jgi:hypothetical protein